MKSLNIKLGGESKAKILKESGRYTAVISQIVDVGLQPGFDARAPQDSIAIVFRVNGGYDVVKKVTLSSHELSALMEIVRAVGLKSEEGGQDPHLADLIGKPLAVEVVLQGTFPKVTQVSPIESFDDLVEPFEPSANCFIEQIEDHLSGPNAKAFVMGLHADVRRLLANRIRNRED